MMELTYFLNGQQRSTSVTAFNVAGSPGTEYTFELFALVVAKPAFSSPSAADFTFAATDANPIPPQLSQR